MNQLDNINEPIIKDSKRIYKIYSLNCPINPEIVRYIGITKCTIRKRLNDHIREKGKSHKINWVKSLKKQNLQPIINVIDEVFSEEEALKKEIEYIKLFKSFGAILTNSTIGGEGCNGHKHTQESKSKISKANKGKKTFGRKVTKETRQLISQSLTGRKNGPPSEEHRAKLSIAHTGKKQSKESIEKMSKAKKGKKLSPEHIENMRISMIGKNKGKKSWNSGKKEVYSEETLEKMSLARKANPPKRETCINNLIKANEANKRIKQERLTMIF